MNWNEDALEHISRIPEDVRDIAKHMVEQWAVQEGVETVTIELIVDLRKKYTEKYGVQKKCPLFRGDRGN